MEININADKIKDQVKKAWDNNPLQVIFVAGVAMGGAAKLLGAVTDARNSRTWKKEVDRRRQKL
jgi:NAD/NADP transhydrogenase alpha subunit